ncbi:serine/threonine-protein kinase [Nocardia sp. NPDC056100]|uniref:serine/threonine-protein kinase n=1 Tax=Nocardia sp. NPDC056100 TaxID=3345712 RepID=UPI0035D93BAD
MVQLSAGQSFAEYTLDGMLGQGGMGSVYLAHHPRLPRQVALKLLGQEVSTDPELRKRFEQEANAIARLDHPNIVGIHDRGVHDGHLWIAMQYVQGVDASRLDPRQVSVQRALRIITETASALDFAHSRGVLHRDVKPANILLSAADTGREERAILTDFGIARLLDSNTQLTSTGMFTATLAYASPEQLSGEQVDHRADQYSLGCTLFALLAGRPPFASTNPGQVVAAHLGQPLPRLSQLRNDVPPQLDDVIARATAKRREDRFASCTEFAAAVWNTQSGRSPALSSRSAPTVIAQHNIPAAPFGQLPHGGDRGSIVDPPGVAAGINRALGGQLLLIAALLAIGSFTALATRAESGDLWEAWRFGGDGPRFGDGANLNLLGVVLAACVLLTGAAGILSLIRAELPGRATRWFTALAAGLAFGGSLTAVVETVVILKPDDSQVGGSPGAGFWLLIAAAIVSLIAVLTCGAAASKISDTAAARSASSGVAGVLLLSVAVTAFVASSMKINTMDYMGLPTRHGVFVVGEFQLPSVALIAAAILDMAAALALLAGTRKRARARSFAISTAALSLSVAVTLDVEALSQNLYFGSYFESLTSGFFALVLTTVLALAALITLAGRDGSPARSAV